MEDAGRGQATGLSLGITEGASDAAYLSAEAVWTSECMGEVDALFGLPSGDARVVATYLEREDKINVYRGASGAEVLRGAAGHKKTLLRRARAVLARACGVSPFTVILQPLIIFGTYDGRTGRLRGRKDWRLVAELATRVGGAVMNERQRDRTDIVTPPPFHRETPRRREIDLAA